MKIQGELIIKFKKNYSSNHTYFYPFEKKILIFEIPRTDKHSRMDIGEEKGNSNSSSEANR